MRHQIIDYIRSINTYIMVIDQNYYFGMGLVKIHRGGNEVSERKVIRK